ncbi:MAG: glycoside hydrolase family 27 protein [Deltaproteobacteria bacterium]|nr:glycoside hydrolase family 27 protein [Deltaproteobacteria bacterium]
MGWNSWNVFHENINEAQIKEIADAMVSSGMKDAGYEYINLDDNWMAARENGNMMVDRTRFPNGMDGLADYIHGLGLKLGIYGDRGVETCHNYNNNITKNSGSYGHEEADAQTFASWGIDYLKYDNCDPAPGRNTDQAQQEDYTKMAEALKATGRPIVFSICAWDYKPWMVNVGHLWRSTFDIGPCFSEDNGCSSWFRNIDQIIDENNESPDAAGPGHWNDPDMLEVGNRALSDTEAASHFSMWAIMTAPLIAGNDIRNMSPVIRDILTNTDVIAVNQDPAGFQGTRVVDNGAQEVWMKPLCTMDGPEKAVALFNRSKNNADITVSFRDIGINGNATVRDLWLHQDMGEFNGSYSASVPGHGVVMLKIVDIAD